MALAPNARIRELLLDAKFYRQQAADELKKAFTPDLIADMLKFAKGSKGLERACLIGAAVLGDLRALVLQPIYASQLRNKASRLEHEANQIQGP